MRQTQRMLRRQGAAKTRKAANGWQPLACDERRQRRQRRQRRLAAKAPTRPCSPPLPPLLPIAVQDSHSPHATNSKHVTHSARRRAHEFSACNAFREAPLLLLNSVKCRTQEPLPRPSPDRQGPYETPRVPAGGAFDDTMHSWQDQQKDATLWPDASRSKS